MPGSPIIAPYERLFSPLRVGGRTVRNRVVLVATIPNYATGHVVTDRTVDYYRERARGGTGVIVTEGLSVHETSLPQPAVITLYDDRCGDGLKRLADAVEGEDCRLIGQLWHVGRQQLWNPVLSPVGVSGEPDAYSWTVPHVLRPDEIRRIVEGFTSAARRLKAAGFSGAELHGAHGYLITQFLSPWSNTRDDEYGGDPERRLRFVREIVEGIRATCGADFVLGLKMPGSEGVAGGIDPEEAGRIVERLAAQGGIDYFAFSQGNFSLSLEDHVPDMHYPPGPFLDIHRRLRQHAGGVPVMALGRIAEPAQAEALLSDGAADLIGLGRALISDAAWAEKARENRAREIRPCIFCNACWGEIHAGKPMACIHNPRLATAGEATWEPRKAAQPRKVVVVGTGVAGLEAAWVAAARGHRVTAFGRSGEIGGKARLEAALPGRGEVARVYEYQSLRARWHGVDLRLGTMATAAMIRAENPDIVVVASGSAMRRPAGLPGTAPGMDLRAYLMQPDGGGKRPGTVVLFDQDHGAGTYAAADLLAGRYERLVLMTPRVNLGRLVPYVSLLGVYRRLYRAGVEIVLAATPIAAEDRRVTWRNAFNGREATVHDVQLFLWSTPRTADDALAHELRRSAIDVIAVGDAHAPRGVMAAVHEAHGVGNRI